MIEKKHILYILLIGILAILFMPVLPHHHHSDNCVCILYISDIDGVGNCYDPHHNDAEQRRCCDDNCPMRLKYRMPNFDTSVVVPEFLCFNFLLFLNLNTPQVNLEYNDLASCHRYTLSLHGINGEQILVLRGPPIMTKA